VIFAPMGQVIFFLAEKLRKDFKIFQSQPQLWRISQNITFSQAAKNITFAKQKYHFSLCEKYNFSR